MTVAVVDASVVVKWFVPEVLEAEAIRVRDGGAALHPIDLEIQILQADCQ